MKATSLVFLVLCRVLNAEPFIEKQDLFTVGEDPAFKTYHIPGIVVTTKGTVLAWCEARRDGSDWDDIQILLRRSTDDGQTWSAPKSIVDVPGPKRKNALALKLKHTDPSTVTYNNPVLIADKDGTVHMLFCLEYERAYYQRSDDDGLTWSTPTEITATFGAFKKVHDFDAIRSHLGPQANARLHAEDTLHGIGQNDLSGSVNGKRRRHEGVLAMLRSELQARRCPCRQQEQDRTRRSLLGCRCI